MPRSWNSHSEDFACTIYSTVIHCAAIYCHNTLHINVFPLLCKYPSHCKFVNCVVLLTLARPHCSSPFYAVRLSGNGVWSFHPYSKWPFIENVNRRIWLPMWRERQELNCSQWVQSEDLIRPWTTSHVFHLCGDDLPPDWNQPGLIPCPLLSGDSCPSGSKWLLTLLR